MATFWAKKINPLLTYNNNTLSGYPFNSRTFVK